MPIRLHTYDEELIKLQEEVTRPEHAPLHRRLNAMAISQDIYMRIAEVAAYCGVVLDGQYTKEDMKDLCNLLVKKLYEHRTQIVLPFH